MGPQFFLLYQKKRIVIKIDGEEHLSVLPMVLCAPLGFVIFYGQPHEGVVKVEITEEKKEKAYSMTCKFQY